MHYTPHTPNTPGGQKVGHHSHIGQYKPSYNSNVEKTPEGGFSTSPEPSERWQILSSKGLWRVLESEDAQGESGLMTSRTGWQKRPGADFTKS